MDLETSRECNVDRPGFLDGAPGKLGDPLKGLTKVKGQRVVVDIELGKCVSPGIMPSPSKIVALKGP